MLYSDLLKAINPEIKTLPLILFFLSAITLALSGRQLYVREGSDRFPFIFFISIIIFGLSSFTSVNQFFDHLFNGKYISQIKHCDIDKCAINSDNLKNINGNDPKDFMPHIINFQVVSVHQSCRDSINNSSCVVYVRGGKNIYSISPNDLKHYTLGLHTDTKTGFENSLKVE